jgi:hypothetical protein
VTQLELRVRMTAFRGDPQPFFRFAVVVGHVLLAADEYLFGVRNEYFLVIVSKNVDIVLRITDNFAGVLFSFE